MSTYHFIRVFKKETDMTPHEYIINYRLRISKILLLESNMSVNDICYESGFSSASIFCAAFKKSVGLSPTAYRKKDALIRCVLFFTIASPLHSSYCHSFNEITLDKRIQ